MRVRCCRLVLNSIFLLYFAPSSSGQTFLLKTQEAGLQDSYYANGVAAADYNNDGYVDLYLVSRFPYDPSRPGSANSLYKNNGDGTFENVAKEAGVEGISIDNTVIINKRLLENFGASWGDYDNDGDVDLFVTNRGVNELYENMSDGTFKNVIHEAKLDLPIRDSSSAAWFDFDRDGDLDLYVSSYADHGLPVSSDNVMYRNNGDGTFTDITAETGLGESGYTYVTLVLDADMNDWQDLYCVNDFGNNYLYVNNADGTFREATEEFGLMNTGQGMGATVGDYDNDGLIDIYFTNIGDDLDGEWSPLFRQTSAGIFEDVSKTSGTGITNWAWGCAFEDFDLDGDLDLYVGNGFSGDVYYNRFFRNNGDGTFKDYSAKSGADSRIEARGLCVADFNNDGRPDINVANLRTTSHLYINTTGHNNFLKVNLIGVQSNRDGRGAFVRVTANNLNYYRTNSGVGFYGQSKVPIHFGLGSARTVESIVVQWPSGSSQTLNNIPANQTITVTENSGTIVYTKDENAPAKKDFTLHGNYPDPVSKIFLRFFITRYVANEISSLQEAAAPIQINNRIVTVHTEDGLELTADLYEPSHGDVKKRRKSAGVVLLGPFLESRQVYSELAVGLCGRGMVVLSVDVRSSGSSAVGSTFDPTSIGKLTFDARGSLEFLASCPSVDPKRLAILGTSITARNALMGASQDENVNALVLISPVLDTSGFEVLRNCDFRPVLEIVSLQDTVSVTQVNHLRETLTHPESRIKSFDNAGIGSGLWHSRARLEMTDLIADWLSGQLK